MSTTVIHQSRVQTQNNSDSDFLITDDFNNRMKTKYNSDLTVSLGELGMIYFNEKLNECLYQEDINSKLTAATVAKILLELQKEYNVNLVGSFIFTTYLCSGDIQGVIYISRDKATVHWLHVEEYSEPKKAIITL